MEKREYDRRYLAEHRERINARRRERHAEHREEVNARKRRHHAANRESINARQRQRHAEDTAHRERVNARRRERWHERYRDHRDEVNARGRANQRKRYAASPERFAFNGARQRCTNPKCKSWKNYGGAGVRFLLDEQGGFPRFLAVLGKKPTPRHSLDRWPDPAGDYSLEPLNLRWATPQQQRANQRKAPRRDLTAIAIARLRKLRLA